MNQIHHMPKLIIDFLDEMIFDRHALGNKTVRDNYVIK